MAWIFDNGLYVVGTAVVMLGAAFVLFGTSMKPWHSHSAAHFLLVATGAIWLLAGLSLPLLVLRLVRYTQ